MNRGGIGGNHRDSRAAALKFAHFVFVIRVIRVIRVIHVIRRWPQADPQAARHIWACGPGAEQS